MTTISDLSIDGDIRKKNALRNITIRRTSGQILGTFDEVMVFDPRLILAFVSRNLFLGKDLIPKTGGTVRKLSAPSFLLRGITLSEGPATHPALRQIASRREGVT